LYKISFYKKPVITENKAIAVTIPDDYLDAMQGPVTNFSISFISEQ
jgi:hypothetical protein